MLTWVLSKRCYRCGRTLPVAEFYADSTRLDGFHQKCRECARAVSAAYYAAHRDRALARMKAYSRRRALEKTSGATHANPPQGSGSERLFDCQKNRGSG